MHPLGSFTREFAGVPGYFFSCACPGSVIERRFPPVQLAADLEQTPHMARTLFVFFFLIRHSSNDRHARVKMRRFHPAERLGARFLVVGTLALFAAASPAWSKKAQADTCADCISQGLQWCPDEQDPGLHWCQSPKPGCENQSVCSDAQLCACTTCADDKCGGTPTPATPTPAPTPAQADTCADCVSQGLQWCPDEKKCQSPGPGCVIQSVCSDARYCACTTCADATCGGTPPTPATPCTRRCS